MGIIVMNQFEVATIVVGAMGVVHFRGLDASSVCLFNGKSTGSAHFQGSCM